jgi:hypothetical protein
MTGFLGEVGKDKEGKIVKDENGQPVVKCDPRVKASDAARVMEAVYSRAEPVKQEPQGGTAPTFIQVNAAFFGGETLPEK